MYYDPYEIFERDGDPIRIAQGPKFIRPRPRGMRSGGMGPGGMWQGDFDLINEISEAIILEAHAYNFYERLADLAATPQQQQIILIIQQDEARHYHWFTMLLRRIGGQQPRIPAGELPRIFREGIREAIQNELEAATFYEEIASQATASPIQMRFMHASNDEQRLVIFIFSSVAVTGSCSTVTVFVFKSTATLETPGSAPTEFLTAFTQCSQDIPSTLKIVFTIIVSSIRLL